MEVVFVDECLDTHTQTDMSQQRAMGIKALINKNHFHNVMQRAQSFFQHAVCLENINVAMQGGFCTCRWML